MADARERGDIDVIELAAVGVADLDGDGRLDLVLSNNNAPPTIYRNCWARSGNWLQLSLEGSVSNRDAIGAAAKVTIADPATGATRTLTRVVEAGSGFASQRMFPLHFGLGESDVVEIRLVWPSGTVQEFPEQDILNLGVPNRALHIREGDELRTRSPSGSPSAAL